MFRALFVFSHQLLILLSIDPLTPISLPKTTLQLFNKNYLDLDLFTLEVIFIFLQDVDKFGD